MKLFEEMISLENLFLSWEQFKRGKRKKKEILLFERTLEDRLFQLQQELETAQYLADPYEHFFVCDPKQRRITKASVRDRFVHYMVHKTLSAVFDQTFIFHCLSGRVGKGTHLGVQQLRRMLKKASQNGTRPCYALKMDIRRFFDSILHDTLKILIRERVHDQEFLHLIDGIIDGFHNKEGPLGRVGIPLGNITSQLFGNIYLRGLDHFIKHDLQEPFYLRYCDDFIVISHDKAHLGVVLDIVREVLAKYLHLELHPNKVTIRKLSQGIDFVGYVLFENHLLVRTRLKQRMQRRLKQAHGQFLDATISSTTMNQKLQSYLGILSHANQYTFSQNLKNAYWGREFS